MKENCHLSDEIQSRSEHIQKVITEVARLEEKLENQLKISVKNVSKMEKKLEKKTVELKELQKIQKSTQSSLESKILECNEANTKIKAYEQNLEFHINRMTKVEGSCKLFKQELKESQADLDFMKNALKAKDEENLILNRRLNKITKKARRKCKVKTSTQITSSTLSNQKIKTNDENRVKKFFANLPFKRSPQKAEIVGAFFVSFAVISLISFAKLRK
jgi:chromosome segregation ATPase